MFALDQVTFPEPLTLLPVFPIVIVILLVQVFAVVASVAVLALPSKLPTNQPVAVIFPVLGLAYNPLFTIVVFAPLEDVLEIPAVADIKIG